MKQTSNAINMPPLVDQTLKSGNRSSGKKIKEGHQHLKGRCGLFGVFDPWSRLFLPVVAKFL